MSRSSYLSHESDTSTEDEPKSKRICVLEESEPDYSSSELCTEEVTNTSENNIGYTLETANNSRHRGEHGVSNNSALNENSVETETTNDSFTTAARDDTSDDTSRLDLAADSRSKQSTDNNICNSGEEEAHSDTDDDNLDDENEDSFDIFDENEDAEDVLSDSDVESDGEVLPADYNYTSPLQRWEEAVRNDLYRAVSDGNEQEVITLLANRHDPNQAYFYDGICDYSALHRAVLNSQTNIIERLLEADCNPDLRDRKKMTPLMLAIHTRMDLAGMLIRAGADVNAVCQDGRSVLMGAVQLSLQTVDFLINAGANVNQRSQEGSTALMCACTNGNVDIVRRLLDAGANVNNVDFDGQTALMCAANCGAGEIAELLLDTGADINTGNFRGITALQHAAAMPRGNIMMGALLKAGCDPDQKDALDHTPLIYAIEMGRAINVRALVASNAAVQYKFPMFGLEFTPFELSHLQVHEMVKCVREGERVTPGERSKTASLLVIMKMLVIAGAKVTAKTGDIRKQLNTVRDAIVALHEIDERENQSRLEAEDSTAPESQAQDREKTADMLVRDWQQYTAILDWLLFVHSEPRPLADICRLHLRNHSRPDFHKNLPHFRLPETLQNYVCLHELNKLELTN